jgi:hypothetical protein
MVCILHGVEDLNLGQYTSPLKYAIISRLFSVARLNNDSCRMKKKTMKKKKKREKWVVVRDTTGGGNRIYHRF